MPFQTGDRVVVRGLGTGVVRDVRRGGRYLVAIGAATMVCTEDQLRDERPRPARGAGGKRGGAEPPSARERGWGPASPEERQTPAPALSLDLHGLTVDEAMRLVDDRLNQALLAGVSRLDIVHGKGHGLIRSALHRHLRKITAVRRFELDARNPGVTHLYL